MEPDPVGEGVVAADRDEVVDAEVADVGEHLGGQVVHLCRVLVAQVGGDVRLRHVGGPGAGGVEEGAAGTADPVDRLLAQLEDEAGIVLGVIAVDLDEAGPAAPDAEHPVPLAQGADGDGADCRVEAGDVAPAGEDGDRAALVLDHGHANHSSLLGNGMMSGTAPEPKPPGAGE